MMDSLVPELRFPEFSGRWSQLRGKNLFSNSRARGNSELPIYSVTLNDGLVPRDTLERHMEANAANETNLRATQGDLVYNMMRMWQGAVGVVERECMVSPAYIVLSPLPTVNSIFFNFNLKRSSPFMICGLIPMGSLATDCVSITEILDRLSSWSLRLKNNKKSPTS